MQTDFLFEIIFALAKKVEELQAENNALRQEKTDMESMMEMASQHSDFIGADLLNRVDVVERQFTEVLESVPVATIITNKQGNFLYANRNACFAFGFSFEEMLKQNAYSLYNNSPDREKFLEFLYKKGEVSNFEVQLKRFNGLPFSVSLFSRHVIFQNKNCILTVIYDLTERLNSEQEIRRLTEQLNREKEREEKYLMFLVSGQEFGIAIKQVREISLLEKITPIPDAPYFIKGVANLRGRFIPVADLRLKLGLEAADYTEYSCIITVKIGENEQIRMIGLIADSVTRIMSIKGKDIEKPSDIQAASYMQLISGIAKVEREVKILLDPDRLSEGF